MTTQDLTISSDRAQLQRNKDIVVAFYDAAINRKDFAAASRFMGKRYRQHNPTARDGPEGLRDFIEMLKIHHPRQYGAIQQVIAEGDRVVLHVHSTRQDGTQGRAIVDIFRLEDGKVVEHWDVIQPIPEQDETGDGMF